MAGLSNLSGYHFLGDEFKWILTSCQYLVEAGHFHFQIVCADIQDFVVENPMELLS